MKIKFVISTERLGKPKKNLFLLAVPLKGRRGKGRDIKEKRTFFF